MKIFVMGGNRVSVAATKRDEGGRGVWWDLSGRPQRDITVENYFTSFLHTLQLTQTDTCREKLFRGKASVPAPPAQRRSN